MPLKLVIDTNILVSAVLKPNSQERLILNLALTDRIDFYISPVIREEYEAVLRRKKFKLAPAEVIEEKSILISPSRKTAASSDDADNRFLECAEEAHADYLVTGNTKDFPPVWKRTKVVTSGELLDLILSIFISWKKDEPA